MKNIGLRIVLAALAVNGPRFVLTFLVADSLKPPPWMEGTILALTGIATGIVLTGGGAYIAHELIVMRGHLVARLFMVLCWLALLASAVIILAPLMAVALTQSELAQVLNTPALRWQWSIVAVVAVEILAAGAMVAHAVSDQPQPTQHRKHSNFDLIANAIAQRIAVQLHSAPSQASQLQSDAPAMQSQPAQNAERKIVALSPQAMEALQMQDNGMTIAEIAETLRKSERTVSNYLKQSKEHRPVVVATNGHSKAEGAQ